MPQCALLQQRRVGLLQEGAAAHAHSAKLAAEAKHSIDYSLSASAHDNANDGVSTDDDDTAGTAGGKGKRAAPTAKELLAAAPAATSSASRNRLTIKLQDGSQPSTSSSLASSVSNSSAASALTVQRSKYRLLSFPRRVGIRPLGVDNNFLMSAHPTLMDLHTMHQRDQAILRHTQLHASERKAADELDRLPPVLQYSEYRPSAHLPFDERYEDRLRKFAASFEPPSDYPTAHFLAQHKLDAIAPPDSAQPPQRGADDWTMDVRLLDGLETSGRRWRQQEPFMTAHEQFVGIKQLFDEARGRLLYVKQEGQQENQPAEDGDERMTDADASFQHGGTATERVNSERLVVDKSSRMEQLNSLPLVCVQLQVSGNGRVNVVQAAAAASPFAPSTPDSTSSHSASVFASLAALDSGSAVLDVLLTFQNRKRQYMLRQQQAQMRQQQQQQQQQHAALMTAAAAHNSISAYNGSSSHSQQTFAQSASNSGHAFISQHTQQPQQQLHHQHTHAQSAHTGPSPDNQPAIQSAAVEATSVQQPEATSKGKGKEKKKDGSKQKGEDKRRKKERKEAERERKRKEREGEDGGAKRHKTSHSHSGSSSSRPSSSHSSAAVSPTQSNIGAAFLNPSPVADL